MIVYFSCFLFPVFFFLSFSVTLLNFFSSFLPFQFFSFYSLCLPTLFFFLSNEILLFSFYSTSILLISIFSWFQFYIQKLTLLIWGSHWSTSNDMLTLGSSSCAVCRTFYNQALHALSPCMPLSMISYKHILISPLTFSFLVVNQA